jgi:hypothetical protein
MTKRINPADIFPITIPSADVDGIGRMLDGCATTNRTELLVVPPDAGVNTGSGVVSSAADIVIPTTRPDRGASQATVLTSSSTHKEVCAVFDGLDALNAACLGASMDGRLEVMITACIERGINTRERIVGALRKKNFNAERSSKFLTKMTGTLWRRSSEGIYSLKD